MVATRSVVHSDPEIMSGTPVFVGTRVPVESLFEFLEAGDSLDEFLDDFPSVSREQAIAAIKSGKREVLRDARDRARVDHAEAVATEEDGQTVVARVLPDADYEIDTVEDIEEAVRLVNADDARVMLAQDGEPVAAVVSIESLCLLLRLEDEELDRIDLEEIEKARADPALQVRIPWEKVKSELGR